jgi:hypothetical protein
MHTFRAPNSNDPTTADRPPDGHRTGATWVAATGAFLLLAAAAVFVATRWSEIPHAAKLGVLAMITAACAYGGDRLRSTLPATGNALFHLGILLVPVDVAALLVHLRMEWRTMLLVEGLVSLAVFAFGARRAQSVVLGAAASGAVIVTSAGVAAVSPVPAACALAVAAVVATTLGRFPRHALVWAGVAAVAPVATLALDGLATGHGVADTLGLLTVAWPWSIATALASAWVITRAARERGEPVLAIVAAVGVVAHGIAAWSAAALPATLDVLVLPSVFLLVELGAFAVRTDTFWSKPAHRAGVVVEFLATFPTMLTLLATVAIVTEPSIAAAPAFAAAGALGACAWVVAGARRDSSWWAAVPGALALGAFAVAAATTSSIAVAASMLAAALGLLMVGDRARVAPVAFGATGYASIVGLADIRSGFVITIVSTLVFALAARLSTGAHEERSTAVLLGLAVLGVGSLVGATEIAPTLVVPVMIATAWIVALAADTIDGRVTTTARAFAFGSLLLLGDLPIGDLLPAALLVTVVAAADSYRTRHLGLAFAAAGTAVLAQVALTDQLGLGLGEAGLTLSVAAAVWFGVAAVTPEPWRRPIALAGAGTSLVGLVAASNTGATFGPALLVTGLLVVAGALMFDNVSIAHAGGALATIGVWTTLAAHAVVISEAYVAPVALQLLFVGAALRKSRPTTSSWVAYGPAVALLTGCAIAERFAGGSAWHSLFAGVVAIVAVVVGGSRRLVAPLLLGTATLVIVVGRESFDTAAGLPTWSWLAAGGATLIGAAVAMERRDVSPVEAGRRVVDVIAANFE